MTDYLYDRLICPSCFTVYDEPFVVGDGCICDGTIVDGRAVREWKRVYDLVGSVVAEARIQRGKGGEPIAVVGAIGKCLIDRDEFDGHYNLRVRQQ